MILAALAAGALAACAGAPPTRAVFRTPGIGPAQWSRIQDECAYEAEKATASAHPKTAVSYARGRLFVMCAELKGATYIGSVAMPDERWKRLSTFCKDEAADAVAGRPASRKRDELKEDLEIECLRRNGANFRRPHDS